MAPPLLWMNDTRPGGNDVTTEQRVVLLATWSTVQFLL